jgi:hypothetical protein
MGVLIYLKFFREGARDRVVLEVVGDILRHSSFWSTSVYARIKKEKRQEAKRVFNG